MKATELYLITWVPRTTIHLREVHAFFSGSTEKLPLLNKRILADHVRNLEIDATSVHLQERNDLEMLSVRLGQFSFSVVEDGIFSLSVQVSNLQESIASLELFYRKNLGPALAYLFSRGAPLPKELSNIAEVYPLVLVVDDASQEDIEGLYQSMGERYDFSVTSQSKRFFFSTQLTVISRLHHDEDEDGAFQELLVGNIVFLQEFNKQLNTYLNFHRSIWDRISKIREQKNLRYKDFPSIRREIMDTVKTLLFVKARLSQMKDIACVREKLISSDIKTELKEYGLFRFESLIGDTQYIMDLWDMTIEYAQGTLVLLESLFQENTQRELSALKFVTFVGVVTGFFGMNIAFPWEERWMAVFPSSLAVIVLLAAVSFGFYGLLRWLIHYRRFVITDTETTTK